MNLMRSITPLETTPTLHCISQGSTHIELSDSIKLKLKVQKEWANFKERGEPGFINLKKSSDIKELTRRKWTEEECLKLDVAVRNKLNPQWELVARFVGRDVSQCKLKSQSLLGERGNPTRWTPQEDAQLKTAVETYMDQFSEKYKKLGEVDWNTVVNMVQWPPGQSRTVAQCSNRWNCHLKQKDQSARGHWKPHEISKFEELVRKHGLGKWRLS